MVLNNEKIIWDALISFGATEAGAAGVMGNLQVESGLSPINLQNNGNAALGMTDRQYTEAVDSGAYTRFATDGYGYGICQWTSSNRKELLNTDARITGVSVGDLVLQLNFLWKELAKSYKSVLTVICTTDSVQEAASAFMLDFERPADKSVSAQEKRGSLGLSFYEKYKEAEGEEMRYHTVAECPIWAQPTIQRMVDNEEVAGTGQGLDLTLEMIRIFVCVEKMQERKG